MKYDIKNSWTILIVYGEFDQNTKPSPGREGNIKGGFYAIVQ
jgi:hypothetical protein